MGYFYERLNPPEKLRKNIIEAVISAEKRTAKRQLMVFGPLSVLLMILSIPLGIHAATLVGQSGFTQYFSLIFSDSAVVLSSFTDYASILFESLPIIEIVYVLAAATLAFWFAVIALNDLGEIKSLRIKTNK